MAKNAEKILIVAHFVIALVFFIVHMMSFSKPEPKEDEDSS
jgi:hypothetical protein